MTYLKKKSIDKYFLYVGRSKEYKKYTQDFLSRDKERRNPLYVRGEKGAPS